MDIRVNPVHTNINFQYKSILKDLYKDGKLPTVKYGIYGNKLTKQNVSIEHLKPRSLGGLSNLKNYALADRFTNSQRGSEDIRNFLTPSMALKYLKQFKDIIVFHRKRLFNGNKYINNCVDTLNSLGIKLNYKA